SDDDQKIIFDSPELTGVYGAIGEVLLLTVLRPLLRKRLTAYLTLPDDLPIGLSQLRGLGASGQQALALPLQLPGGKDLQPTSQSISNIFLGSSDFAVAISKEYVLDLLQTNLDELKKWKPQFDVSSDYYPDATYTIHVNTAKPHWKGTGHVGIISVHFEG